MLGCFLDKRLSKVLPSESNLKQGLYMFDVGQNDLDGAFHSKTEDQVVASIPNILLEFETGLKVKSLCFHTNFTINRFLAPKISLLVALTILFCTIDLNRDYTTRAPESFGYTTPVPSDASRGSLTNSGRTPQSSTNSDALHLTTTLQTLSTRNCAIIVLSFEDNLPKQTSLLLTYSL